MREGLFILYSASILFSAVMALAFRKSIGQRKLIILMPYLFLVFVQELCLHLGEMFQFFTANAIVYNIYRPVTVIIFGIIYYQVPIMAPLRRLMLWIIGLYLLANIITYSFINSVLVLNGHLVMMRGFVITCLGIFFLFRYFSLDDRREEEFWRPLLWLSIGVMIFYPVVSISLTFQKFLANSDARIAGFRLYNLIPQLLSIFMYGCFSYAFYLCSRKLS